MGWSGSAEAFVAGVPAALAGAGRTASDARATLTGIALLQDAMQGAVCRGWHVVLGMRLLRVGRGVDAVLIRDGVIVALCMRPDARAALPADRRAAEDAALDLAEFHAGCRGLPVIPVLVVGSGHVRHARPLPLAGAAPVVEATRLLLPGVLRDLAALCPPMGNDPAAWHAAPYRPVPSLIGAACALYARHDVPALLQTQAGHGGMAAAADAVAAAVQAARQDGAHAVVFVTGAPGAGKTLLGLNLAFAGSEGAAFLTGNPSLVHVLREALVRDAAARGGDRRAARRRVSAVIQALPAFRDHHASGPGAPPERLVVIDEAQRCWDAAHAVSKTRNRPAPLRDSEPGHLLDAMGRHAGWAVIVCLVGGGQEIHDGEGGLAAWGAALTQRPGWRAAAAPGMADDPRQRLDFPGVAWDPRLHLGAPVRAIGTPQAAAWVDAVLAGDADAAQALAAGGAAFQVTRSLDATRGTLWGGAGRGGAGLGTRRVGLVGSSGARRLRAEGLGAVLPHQDEDAVTRWFLDSPPDMRGSGALEVLATEFCVQGLELDRAGLCWDGDLVRMGGAWVARRCRGSAWTTTRTAEARSNRINAYRVLLTRARHGTVIWVPRGDARDPTRDPALYDGVAEYLLSCGALTLAEAAPADDIAACLQPELL